MAIIEQTTVLKVTHVISSNKLIVESVTAIIKGGDKTLAKIYDSVNYNSTEKAKFQTALGADADKYILLAGW